MSIEKTINDLTAAILTLAKVTEENTAAAREMLALRTVGAAVEIAKTGEQATPEKAEAPAEKPQKAKPAKKAKPEPEPEAAETPDPDADEKAEAEADEPVKAEAVPSAAEVKDIAIRCRDEAGIEALEKAKRACKISKVSELPEENRAMFIRHCQKLIDEAAEV